MKFLNKTQLIKKKGLSQVELDYRCRQNCLVFYNNLDTPWLIYYSWKINDENYIFILSNNIIVVTEWVTNDQQFFIIKLMPTSINSWLSWPSVKV